MVIAKSNFTQNQPSLLKTRCKINPPLRLEFDQSLRLKHIQYKNLTQLKNVFKFLLEKVQVNEKSKVTLRNVSDLW